MIFKYNFTVPRVEYEFGCVSERVAWGLKKLTGSNALGAWRTLSSI